MATIALPRPRRRGWSAARRRRFALRLVLPGVGLVAFAGGLTTAVATTAPPAPPARLAPTGAASRLAEVTDAHFAARLEALTGIRRVVRGRPAPRFDASVPFIREQPPPVLPRRNVPIRWRRSVAVGRPDAGRLVRGVQLPPSGRHHVTWDPILLNAPNRPWRVWGTDRLVRTILAVARGHARAHPKAPRMVVGDLSRPRGGPFGPSYGGLGHASHQNGLDVDISYPRRDGYEVGPSTVAEIDLPLAQALVDRWVRAGAQYVFIGYRTPLTGPPGVVVRLPYHDDHMHVRLR